MIRWKLACGSDLAEASRNTYESRLDKRADAQVSVQKTDANLGHPADFNGDGKLDLAVGDCGRFSCGVVSILLGNGDGTFQPYVDYLVPFGSGLVAVGDFNRDGKPDLVLGTGDMVTALLNTAGTRVKLASSPNPSDYGQSVTFTAIVRPTVKGSGTLTGRITFDDESRKLGTIKLVNGIAHFRTSKLAAGKHKITAHYSGNKTFGPNTSPPLIQIIKP